MNETFTMFVPKIYNIAIVKNGSMYRKIKRIFRKQIKLE